LTRDISDFAISAAVSDVFTVRTSAAERIVITPYECGRNSRAAAIQPGAEIGKRFITNRSPDGHERPVGTSLVGREPAPARTVE
jgi:hypothetical protein